jgi:hypothetical protein
MNVKDIEPAALAAGVVTALVMISVHRKRRNRCVMFDEIWDDTDPNHIKPELQNEIFELGFTKMRSVEAAEVHFGRPDLQIYLAEQTLPNCNWKNIGTDRGKKILEGFGNIADYIWDKFYGDKGSEG